MASNAVMAPARAHPRVVTGWGSRSFPVRDTGLIQGIETARAADHARHVRTCPGRHGEHAPLTRFFLS